MQLQTYLKLKGISEKQFADAVGGSEAGVKKWVRRERIPRPDAMRLITEKTEGAVTAADFFDAAPAKPGGERESEAAA